MYKCPPFFIPLDSRQRAPFNIEIYTSRPSYLTVSWEHDLGTTTSFQLQYRALGDMEWIDEVVITDLLQNRIDIVPLQGHTYYEVRLNVIGTNQMSLISRFHTCEKGRGGPNCEFSKLLRFFLIVM